MFFSREALKSEILASLGADFVPVEISNEAADRAINQTIRVFSRYVPLTKRLSQKTEQTGFDHIDLPSYVRGIKHVNIIVPYMGGVQTGWAIESQLLSGVPVLLGIADVNLDVAYLHYRRLFLKTVSREVGNDPDWEAVKDPETGLWTVYTFATAGPGVLVDIEAYIDYADDLHNIPPDFHASFADYALGEAKCTVGEARGKFLRVPVAGASMEMNGQALKNEGELKKTTVLEDWKKANTGQLYPRWC